MHLIIVLAVQLGHNVHEVIMIYYRPVNVQVKEKILTDPLQSFIGDN